MSNSQKITVLNLGTGVRILPNVHGRQTAIQVGEQKTVEVHNEIVQSLRRTAARETLRIVGESVTITPTMQKAIAILRNFNLMSEDTLIRESIEVLGANAFPLRPPRHLLRTLLANHIKSIASEEPEIGEVLKNDPAAPAPEAKKPAAPKSVSELPNLGKKEGSVKGSGPKIKVR